MKLSTSIITLFTVTTLLGLNACLWEDDLEPPNSPTDPNNSAESTQRAEWDSLGIDTIAEYLDQDGNALADTIYVGGLSYYDQLDLYCSELENPPVDTIISVVDRYAGGEVDTFFYGLNQNIQFELDTIEQTYLIVQEILLYITPDNSLVQRDSTGYLFDPNHCRQQDTLYVNYTEEALIQETTPQWDEEVLNEIVDALDTLSVSSCERLKITGYEIIDIQGTEALTLSPCGESMSCTLLDSTGAEIEELCYVIEYDCGYTKMHPAPYSRGGCGYGKADNYIAFSGAMIDGNPGETLSLSVRVRNYYGYELQVDVSSLLVQ